MESIWTIVLACVGTVITAVSIGAGTAWKIAGVRINGVESSIRRIEERIGRIEERVDKMYVLLCSLQQGG